MGPFRVPTRVHAIHGRGVLEGYRPPFTWTPRVYSVDQERQLLPRTTGGMRPSQGVPPFDWGTITPVASAKAQ